MISKFSKTKLLYEPFKSYASFSPNFWANGTSFNFFACKTFWVLENKMKNIFHFSISKSKPLCGKSHSDSPLFKTSFIPLFYTSLQFNFSNQHHFLSFYFFLSMSCFFVGSIISSRSVVCLNEMISIFCEKLLVKIFYLLNLQHQRNFCNPLLVLLEAVRFWFSYHFDSVEGRKKKRRWME